jgi:hypothetical protein
MKRILLSLAIVAVLFFGIIVSKERLTGIRGAGTSLESMAYLPGSERIKPFMLGFNTTYAHYLWIKTIIYSGERMESDRQFTWLVQMLDMITRLHPHFNEAYEFAGLMVPDLCGNPDAAKIILERGMNVFGTTRWNIPFYLGMLYHRYYNDPERAAVSFSTAAQAPGNFQGRLASLAATFYNNADRDTDALDVLVFLYESSENPEVRRHIAAKIEELMGKNQAETGAGDVFYEKSGTEL